VGILLERREESDATRSASACSGYLNNGTKHQLVCRMKAAPSRCELTLNTIFVMLGRMVRRSYTCKQCGYRWMTRWGQRPGRCANKACRSARWDQGKVDGPRRRGRPPRIR